MSQHVLEDSYAAFWTLDHVLEDTHAAFPVAHVIGNILNRQKIYKGGGTFVVLTYRIFEPLPLPFTS